MPRYYNYAQKGKPSPHQSGLSSAWENPTFCAIWSPTFRPPPATETETDSHPNTIERHLQHHQAPSHHRQTPWRDELTAKQPRSVTDAPLAVRWEPRHPAASMAGYHAYQNLPRKDHLAVRPRSGQPNKKPNGSTKWGRKEDREQGKRR